MNPNPFSSELINALIVNAMQNVFSTMLSKEIDLVSCEIYPNSTQQAPSKSGITSSKTIVTSSVGFAGVINGVVYISMEEDIAMYLTGAMLGMEPDEVVAEGEDTVNDCLGEIANMSVGNFKNKLCDKGYSCMLTIPSILRGHKISVVSNTDDNIYRYIYQFVTDGKPLVVDLIFKPTE